MNVKVWKIRIKISLIFTDLVSSFIFKGSKLKETKINILKLYSKLAEMEI